MFYFEYKHESHALKIYDGYMTGIGSPLNFLWNRLFGYTVYNCIIEYQVINNGMIISIKYVVLDQTA